MPVAHGHNTEVRPGSNAYRREQEERDAKEAALERRAHRLKKALDSVEYLKVPWSAVSESQRGSYTLQEAKNFVKKHTKKGGRRATRKARKTRRKH